MQGDVYEMGLFMNEEQHPELFKNPEDVQAKNQGSYQYNEWTEFLIEQKRANEELNQAFLILHQLHQRQDRKQAQRWSEIGGQIEELREINFQREAFEKFALELLEKLEGQQRNGVELEAERNREIFDRINVIDLSNQEIIQRLEQLGVTEEKMVTQVEETQGKLSQQLLELREEAMNKIVEQETKQQIMDKQMEKHDAHHQEVIERLEKQEAISEKIMREIQHIRSVLFERASFLAEKVEHGYKLTSAYFQKFVQGADSTAFDGEKEKVESGSKR